MAVDHVSFIRCVRVSSASSFITPPSLSLPPRPPVYNVTPTSSFNASPQRAITPLFLSFFDLCTAGRTGAGSNDEDLSIRAHVSFTVLLLLSAAVLGCDGLRMNPHPSSSRGQADINGDRIDDILKEKRKGETGAELFPTGSSLPDCSHACGPCVPCKRVIVSYKCSIESCPVVYRCMCKGKYYHVPSH